MKLIILKNKGLVVKKIINQNKNSIKDGDILFKIDDYTITKVSQYSAILDLINEGEKTKKKC